jgi:hypothetical protein
VVWRLTNDCDIGGFELSVHIDWRLVDAIEFGDLRVGFRGVDFNKGGASADFDVNVHGPISA